MSICYIDYRSFCDVFYEFAKEYSMTIEDLLQNKLIKGAKEKSENDYQQTSNKIAKIFAELKILLNKHHLVYSKG